MGRILVDTIKYTTIYIQPVLIILQAYISKPG